MVFLLLLYIMTLKLLTLRLKHNYHCLRWYFVWDMESPFSLIYLMGILRPKLSTSTK